MGFKRTAEGRVFFQGKDGEAAPEKQQLESREPLNQASYGSGLNGITGQKPADAYQVQLLSLLKNLNERLKTTQKERNEMRRQLDTYRDLIEGLARKTDESEETLLELERRLSQKDKNEDSKALRAENIARETLKELEETRRILSQVEGQADSAEKIVKSVKALQKQQDEKITNTAASYARLKKRLRDAEARQEEFSLQIEETRTGQAKLLRQIEKANEDRMRFMRKIERIEDTVIQTRDALNAKAMVLLTDQGVAQVEEEVQAAPDKTLPPVADKKARQEQTAGTFWARDFQMPAGGAALLILGAVIVTALFTWAMVSLQRPNLPDLSDISFEELVQSYMPYEGEGGEVTAPVSIAGAGPGGAAESQEGLWSVEQDTAAFAPVGNSRPEEQALIDRQAIQSEPQADKAETADKAEQTSQAGQDNTAVDTQDADRNAVAVHDKSVDDLGMVDLTDEEQLISLLEKNPDVLAAELNKIEPGSQIIAEAQNPAAAPAPAKPEAPDAQDARVAETAAKQAAGSDLHISDIQENLSTLLEPDPALPGAIRQVEDKAFAGDPKAQHDLAAIYTAGHGGAPQDYQRAMFWFRKAAEQGIANAAYNLGVLYHQGMGASPDILEAIRWYETAATLGHPEAQYNLGIAYIEGIGVPYNASEAARYFEQAAQTGIMEAAYNLGLIYENGLLGEAKPDEALMWYKTAADQGSPEARAALEQLAETLDIKIEDVNRLADSMMASRNVEGQKKSLQ